MGLLDKMFGGGTKLDLKLDTDMIPEGGTLSGACTLSGGKKPLKLNALKVRLVYVKVTTKPGQSLPQIDMQVLLDNTVVANQDLPPASLQKYEFSFQVPTGTDPKGTYKVMATADIPGVKDPAADTELKVISPNSEGANPGLFGGLFKGKPKQEEILGRFPDLMSREEDTLCRALSDLLCAAYDADNNFVNIAPWLAQKMGPGNSERVRTAALAAWGNVLNNRATPEHIKALEAMAVDPSLSSDMMREVVTVAAKFAEEGGLPLVRQLASHRDPEVRTEMATRLYFDADKELPERKQLILALTDDADPGVRAAAYRAFADFSDDRAMVERAVQAAARDQSPDVQTACLSAITIAHHHGMADLVLDTLQQHTQNQNSSVREELADCVHWLPVDPRTATIVQALLSDPSVEVRRKMAWQACNMSEHQELKELFMRAATSDPDEEVRGNALGGMDRLMPLPEALKFLRSRLAADPTEKTAWGCFNVVKFQMEDGGARALMEELTRVPFARVAQRAREELAG
ncbi:MAG: HEAT repeat domain-containing protein [Deltaproteobacteria bacterium]|nr:HEAT repeat domain-containing protein [Deltaproteobacteria bacterium]